MTTQQQEPITERAYSMDDLYVVSEGGVDVAVLNLTDLPQVPPYYVDIDGRRFVFTSRTYPIKGHAAQMPREVQAESDAGRLALLVERGPRYYLYVCDPAAAEADGDDEE